MLPVCFIMMPAGGAGAATDAPAEVDQEPWRKNPRVFTRTNSPASRPVRSGIWTTVRRLYDTHPANGGFAHLWKFARVVWCLLLGWLDFAGVIRAPRDSNHPRRDLPGNTRSTHAHDMRLYTPV